MIHPLTHRRDWGAIFRESRRVLYEEVDYTREGKNAERFSENFKGTEWIKAPGINWSRSTRKVCAYSSKTARVPRLVPLLRVRRRPYIPFPGGAWCIARQVEVSWLSLPFVR